MKKNFIYALMSAIALTGAVSFSACSSNEEIVDSPDYNPEDNTVKTEFSISFPKKLASSTRQASAEVQATNVFTGMQDILLIPFSGTSIAAGDAKLGGAIGIPTTLANNALAETSNSKVYTDVTVPVGTSSFLFYARAAGAPADDTGTLGVQPITSGTGAATVLDLFKYGFTTASDLTTSTVDYLFTPLPIYNSTTENAKGAAIRNYLTGIAKATGWSTTGNEGLADLYTNFKALTAGSSTSVQAAVQDLYLSVWKNTDPVSTAIAAAILKDNKGTPEDESDDVQYATRNESTGVLTFEDNVSGYPGNINLPDGAIKIQWNDTSKEFEAVSVPTFGNLSPTTVSTTPLNQYVYPAALWYRANTPILVSNAKQSDNYGSKVWSEGTTHSTDVLSLYTDGASVKSSTRSIALVNQIEYAVGRLDIKVNLEASSLYDGNKDEIVIDNANSKTIDLTGVLIGGQKAVDFEFHPSSSATTYYTIYDPISTTTVPTSAPANVQNYTMALETPKADVDATNGKIKIALEFVNNTGTAFQGVDGIIEKGCKFYLVADLNPTAASGVTDAAKTEYRVFRQDYITTVNMVVKAGSSTAVGGLAKAYNVIPDLRTPQLELGLSVNLEWNDGIKFNVDIQ